MSQPSKFTRKSSNCRVQTQCELLIPSPLSCCSPISRPMCASLPALIKWRCCPKQAIYQPRFPPIPSIPLKMGICRSLLSLLPLAFLVLFAPHTQAKHHHGGFHHDHGRHHVGPEHAAHAEGGGGHGPSVQQENTMNGPCGCGTTPGSTHGGIPIFIFPDHVQRAVDIVLRAEGVFLRDNDELARHLFNVLAHQFPRKWFLVAIGNLRGSRPKAWASGGQHLLSGEASVNFPRGYVPFPFFEGRFRRENGSSLWYLVYAAQPFPGREQLLSANCLGGSCVPRDSGRVCNGSALQLGMSAHIPAEGTQTAVYASEPLANDGSRMELFSSLKECDEEGEGDEEEGEAEEGSARMHVLLVAKQREGQEQH